MRKTDKLIVKAFLGPFLLTFFVVVFILLMHYMIRYFDDIVGKGVDYFLIIELFFYFGVSMAPTALPLAVLLSSLISYGSLGEHHELTAIKGAGVSLLHIIWPVAILVSLISAGGYFLSNNIIPKTNLRAYSLIWDIKHKKPALDLKPGVFYQGIPGYSIKVEDKAADDKTLKRVMIYDHSTGKGNSKITLADSGIMYTIYNERYLVFELFDGVNYTEMDQNNQNSKEQGHEFVRNYFQKSKIVFSLESFQFSRTDMDLFRNNRMMRNNKQLEGDANELKDNIKNTGLTMNSSVRNYYIFKFKDQDTNQVYNDSIANFLNKHVAVTDSLDKHKINEIVMLAQTQARNLKVFAKSQFEKTRNFQRDYNRTLAEIHRKFTQAVICLILFFIGAPLGAIVKKGGLGVPILISIVLFIVYYIFSVSVEKFSRENFIYVYFAMWLPIFVFCWLGIYFLVQARNDSRLLDLDTYRIFFKNLFSKSN